MRKTVASAFVFLKTVLSQDEFEFSCNFDSGLCYGWESSPIGEFEWERNSGPTATANTGPAGDHTSGQGYYMFAESSRPRQQGDRAILLSPVFQGGRKLCASYWYHMNGTGMGDIIVTVEHLNGSPGSTFNTQLISGNQGPSWKLGYFDVVLAGENADNYRVQFMAKRGSSFASDMAIDDIKLIPVSLGQPCPNNLNDTEGMTQETIRPIEPDFRFNSSAWRHDRPRGRARRGWHAGLRASTASTAYHYGPRPKSNTKEPTNQFNGPFNAIVYLTTQEPITQEPATQEPTTQEPTTQDRRRVPPRGRSLQTVLSQGSCPPLSSPQMLTSPTGSLTSSNYPQEYTTNQNCSWIIQAPQNSVVKLNIEEAILESMDQNECMDFLEISDPDDGTVLAELCQQNAPKTFFSLTNRVQLSLIQDGSVAARGFALNWSFLKNDEFEYSCDFESGLCYGWGSSPIGEFEWEMISGPTATANTGPAGDHTSGHGYYMYAESSRPRQQGDRAILLSPVFQGGRKLCASYWYHMNGTGMGDLVVTVEQLNGSPGSTFNTQLISGNKGPTWKQGYFDVDLRGGITDSYQVQFMAKRGTSYASDMAIDDIQLIWVSFDTPCPNIPSDAGTEAPTGLPDLFTTGLPPLLETPQPIIVVENTYELFDTTFPPDLETTAPGVLRTEEFDFTQEAMTQKAMFQETTGPASRFGPDFRFNSSGRAPDQPRGRFSINSLTSEATAQGTTTQEATTQNLTVATIPTTKTEPTTTTPTTPTTTTDILTTSQTTTQEPTTQEPTTQDCRDIYSSCYDHREKYCDHIVPQMREKFRKSCQRSCKVCLHPDDIETHGGSNLNSTKTTTTTIPTKLQTTTQEATSPKALSANETTSEALATTETTTPRATTQPTTKTSMATTTSTLTTPQTTNIQTDALCEPGFNNSIVQTSYDTFREICVDIDECDSNSNPCSNKNQICKNLPGSYQCVCQKGYRMFQSQCLDVDECTENFHSCTNDQKCINHAGGFNCIIKPHVNTHDKPKGKKICFDYEQLTFINNIAYCMVKNYNRYYSQPRRLPWTSYNSFSEKLPAGEVSYTRYNNRYVGVPIRLKNWKDSHFFSTGQAITSTGHHCQVYCAKRLGKTTECKYQFCYA